MTLLWFICFLLTKVEDVLSGHNVLKQKQIPNIGMVNIVLFRLLRQSENQDSVVLAFNHSPVSFQAYMIRCDWLFLLSLKY